MKKYTNIKKILDKYAESVYNIDIEGGEQMKTSELIKRLKEIGCKLMKQNKKHSAWYSPKTGQIERVWRHQKEVPTSTAEKILKKMGAK